MLRTAYVGTLAAVLATTVLFCLGLALITKDPSWRWGALLAAMAAVLVTLLWRLGRLIDGQSEVLDGQAEVLEGQARLLDALRADIIDTLDAVRVQTVAVARTEQMTVPMIPVSELARRSVIYASAPVPPPVPPIPAVELPASECREDHAKIYNLGRRSVEKDA